MTKGRWCTKDSLSSEKVADGCLEVEGIVVSWAQIVVSPPTPAKLGKPT